MKVDYAHDEESEGIQAVYATGGVLYRLQNQNNVIVMAVNNSGRNCFWLELADGDIWDGTERGIMLEDGATVTLTQDV